MTSFRGRPRTDVQVEGLTEVMAAFRNAIATVDGRRLLRERAGVTDPLISNIHTGRQEMSPKIAIALGYEVVLVYRKLSTP